MRSADPLVSDQNYPRLETIRDLLRMITAYPRLGKEAAQSLIDLGDAIKDVASVTEVQGLVAGTLSKDLTVRKAALEALQPVDMTELDYSEEIWIAVHDADEQNAKLALHLWDDNGLDLPETFLSTLPRYLGTWFSIGLVNMGLINSTRECGSEDQYGWSYCRSCPGVPYSDRTYCH